MSAIQCKELVRNQTDVSLAIARHVSLEQLKEESNLVFSPLSLNLLVSMTAAGAGGPSREQLLRFLKSASTDDVNKLNSDVVSFLFDDWSRYGGPILSIANGVWIQEGLSLNHSFKQVVEDVYKASSYHVDFKNKPAGEIRSQVNSWAEKQTKGLIKNILSPNSINELTRLILANALHFRAAWCHDFDASLTKEHDFNLLSGDSVKVPFMTRDTDQCIATFDGFKVLALPYTQGDYDHPDISEYDKRHFSMYIFLPDSLDGLPALMEKLWSETETLERHLPREKVPVKEFRIPKFKISSQLKAIETLKQLGVELPFIPGGLTETVDCPEESALLCASGIYHKACIAVDEIGTEAASLSEDDMMGCSFYQPPREVVFVADHPFMFVIREDTTGVVLFAGHILNPLEE